MSKIKQVIETANERNEKSLTVFLTSGFPNPNNFAEMALSIADAGADLLEIGLPFGDSLADGPVIQSSYTSALANNINLEKTFVYISQIRKESDVPIILMGASNPVLKYGKTNFAKKAIEAGINGVIIPDVPLEEYDDFFEKKFVGLDTILLTTPTSSIKRIKEIDSKSSGFLYCVSIVGTTGTRNHFDQSVTENLRRTYNSVEKNKMQIGFGISSGENIKQFSPYCDGVIVGSAIIKSFSSDDSNYTKTIQLVKELKSGCKG